MQDGGKTYVDLPLSPSFCSSQYKRMKKNRCLYQSLRDHKKFTYTFFANVHIHLTYLSKSNLHIIYASSLQICTHRPPFNHRTASEMLLKSTKSFIQANLIMLRPIRIRIVNKFCRLNNALILAFLCLEKRLILIL